MLLLAVLAAPAPGVRWPVVGAGLAAWWQRERLLLLSEALADVGRAAEAALVLKRSTTG
jgi:hypothetical protein